MIKRPWWLGVNTSLWLGGGLTLLVLWLAWAGPSLAPRDPMQETFILQAPTGQFIRPPYPPLSMPGFPLGADELGRDVLSRLLVAVRPTLTLTVVVAALRLALGLIIGLIAGWASGWLGRMLEVLIISALAAPVLFVALFVLAAFGRTGGVAAFILGLTLTGWAEVARLASAQTRAIKGQRYIEAARALGATDVELLGRHVLPQIVPLMWMWLAFEASGALLTVAGLGFLGYFINSIWVPLGDFSGIRMSGQPELGQMLNLASAARQPWAALAAGALVILTVLAFNWLGDGLRLELSPERRRTPLLPEWMNAWLEDRLLLTLVEWRRTLTLGGAVAILLMVIVGGGWWLWQAQGGGVRKPVLVVPGNHLWAAKKHDASGTGWTSVVGPTAGEVRWVFTATAGFTGGPVIAADGTLYLATRNPSLLALSSDGQIRWALALPMPVAGTPALSADGDILLLTGQGGLVDVTPEGRLRWTFEAPRSAAPLASPIIDAHGDVYWVTERDVLSVSRDGRPRWRVNLPTYSYSDPLLRLTADGRYLLFETVVLDAASGETIIRKTITDLDKYMVGAEGGNYLRTQTEVYEWSFDGEHSALAQKARLDARGLGLAFRFSLGGGVTPDDRMWFHYASDIEFDKVVWTDTRGNTLQVLDYAFRNGTFIGLDGVNTVYVCGTVARESSTCRAHRPDFSATPLWQLDLPTRAFLLGGAIAPNRLYIVAEGGCSSPSAPKSETPGRVSRKPFDAGKKAFPRYVPSLLLCAYRNRAAPNSEAAAGQISVVQCANRRRAGILLGENKI